MSQGAKLGGLLADSRAFKQTARAGPVQLAGLSPVLVIEDNYLAAVDLARMLDDWSIETRSTPHVAAARALASEMRPKLALVDINLERGFEGLFLGRELQALYATKIVFITGYALRDLKDCMAGGDATAVLFKPIDQDILAAVLTKISAMLSAAH